MAREVQAFHALRGIREAVRGRVQVRVVYLVRVAREDDLGILADAADDRLDLVGRQVLGLVNDDELVGDAPAADVGQGLEFQRPGVDEVRDAFVHAPVAALLPRRDVPLRPQNVGQVVEDRLHPLPEFLLFRARQVPDVLAERDDRPRDQQFLVPLLHQHLLHAAGDGQERLAGAGGAHQRHQAHGIEHQQFDRHPLLRVAGRNVLDRLVGEPQGDDAFSAGVESADHGGLLVAGALEKDELVGLKVVGGRLDAVLALQAAHRCRVDLDLAVAHVDPIEVHLLLLEVHRPDAERVALNAGVDVL